MAGEPENPLSYDACREYLYNEIFHLRPPDYGERYPRWPGLVGIELESLVFRKSDWDAGEANPIALFGERSIAATVQEIARSQGWQPNIDDQGRLANVKITENDQITFEPGGQVELSLAPTPCLSDSLDELYRLQEILSEGFSQAGYCLVQSGINPWHTPDEIGLQMNKPRYKAMNSYFTKISPMGQRMMRQTCTVQVNLDFGPDDATLAKRYLVGNLLSPVATAVFANSPWVNGSDSKLNSSRAEAWRRIDPSRTGLPNLKGVAEKLDRQACVDAYLDSVLSAPVIFIESLNYHEPEGLSFAKWVEEGYRGKRPTLGDFATHLTLHFPEVRPRGFLELRSVDSQSRVWQAVPAALYTAILYTDEGLEAALELLLPKIDSMGPLLEAASRGLSDPEVLEIAQPLVDIAIRQFKNLPPCFQGEGTEQAFAAYCEAFVHRKRTPADDIRDQVVADGQFLPSTLDRVEARWSSLVL